MSQDCLLLGDNRVVLADWPDATFDACVTDPPYGIGFMAKEWDTFKPGVEATRIVPARGDTANPNVKGRVRSPASSPSAVEYDRTLAGQYAFEAWTESWAREVYRVLKPGAHLTVFGAPRAHHRMMSGLEDAGFEIRDCLAWMFGQGFPKSLNLKGAWQGWGTALKPAFEPIALARKPFKGTLTANVARWGTGALNIDGCRVGDGEARPWCEPAVIRSGNGDVYGVYAKNGSVRAPDTTVGRWPANLALDEVAATALGEQSRFFYCPKVSRVEREFGCDALPAKSAGDMCEGRAEGSAGLDNPRAGAGRTSGSRNPHPTVKPIALMRWLVRLVTPPGGLVLDPFVGSGSTGIAAQAEGCEFIGIDAEHEWLTVAAARMNAWAKKAAA